MSKFIIFFLLLISINIHSQIKNGYYEGLEKMDIKDRMGQWYRQNILSIRNDSIYLNKAPICKTQKDTLYSAADYGFYYYAGLISKKGNKNYFSIFLIDCDYFITKISDDSLKTSEGLSNDTITYRLYQRQGNLIFNNVKYKYRPEKTDIVKYMDFRELFMRKKRDAIKTDVEGVIDN